jgi:hypothetical protein
MYDNVMILASCSIHLESLGVYECEDLVGCDEAIMQAEMMEARKLNGFNTPFSFYM